MASEAVTERVRSLFLRALNIDVPSADADLIEGGLLDSLGLVELLFALEQEFGIQISFDSIDIEIFRTVSTIGHFVESASGNGSA